LSCCQFSHHSGSEISQQGILYSSWQSYTYCNCDKIVTYFIGRTTDNIFQCSITSNSGSDLTKIAWQLSPNCVVCHLQYTVIYA